MTSYQSAIIAVSVSFSRYLTLKNIVTMKSRLEVTRPANLCTVCTSLQLTNRGLPSAADSVSIFIHFYAASSGKKHYIG